jgi:hypothetical protein
VIFLLCYVLLFTDPPLTGLVGWLAMPARQSGHFLFEPNGCDALTNPSNDYEEAIEVGYDQARKIVLLAVCGLAPVALAMFPTLLGLFAAPVTWTEFIAMSALSSSRPASAAACFA